MGQIAFFVTHEYLWTKEHNDLMLFYLIDIEPKYLGLTHLKLL